MRLTRIFFVPVAILVFVVPGLTGSAPAQPGRSLIRQEITIQDSYYRSSGISAGSLFSHQ